MPSYQPPKKNTEYIFYTALVDAANRPDFKSSPTIASGDFKVSTDGGALANLSTIPAVTPSSSVMVKFTLSTSEMNGDNVTVVCVDAAGAEWDDLVINIQTAVRQIDDLTYLGVAIEGSTTLQQALTIMLAALAGKSSGGGTTAVAFRDVADGKNRISATVDVNGNRTSVTIDGS